MTPDQFRQIIREELHPIAVRLHGVEDRLGGVEAAILILADNLPGTMPGEKSHVRTQIEEAFAEAS